MRSNFCIGSEIEFELDQGESSVGKIRLEHLVNETRRSPKDIHTLTDEVEDDHGLAVDLATRGGPEMRLEDGERFQYGLVRLSESLTEVRQDKVVILPTTYPVRSVHSLLFLSLLLQRVAPWADEIDLWFLHDFLKFDGNDEAGVADDSGTLSTTIEC